MKKIFFSLLLLFTFLFLKSPALAQPSQVPKQDFHKGLVIQVTKEGTKSFYGTNNLYQELNVKILDGKDSGKNIQVENGGQIHITKSMLVKKGDTVVLSQVTNPDNKVSYAVYDIYRLNYLPYLIGAFVIFVLVIAGLKGLGSLLGMIVSLGVIGVFIVPSILHGYNPLLICTIGSFVILFVTTYLAHGFSKQTTVALISTLIALLFTALLSAFVVNLTRLAGVGNEDAVSLQLSTTTASINLQGLLLGGIIIGTLGALNDITTTQSAAIFELAKHKNFEFEKLLLAGFNVGREHIASLVNTLLLAYVGSSLALFIYFVLNPSGQPLWVILNGETVFDEIIIIITGSLGLISVVPIVTILATFFSLNKSSD